MGGRIIRKKRVHLCVGDLHPMRFFFSLRGSGQQLLQLLLVIFVKIVEVVDLVIVGLLLALGQLGVLAHDLLDLLLKRLDVLVVLLAGSFQVADVLLHLILALLGHEGLAHAVSNGTLVERLIGLDGHLDFVTDTHQEEAALSAVDSDLADQLVEALAEELLTEGADARLAGHRALQRLVELVLQIDNVDLRGGLRRDVTHPEGALIGEFSRRQDRVEVVLITLLLVLPRLLQLVHGRLLLSLRLLVRDAGGDEHGVVVPDERVGRLLRHLQFSNRLIAIIKSHNAYLLNSH